MPKFIESEESIAYKKRFKEFSASINPKPTEEERQALHASYLEARYKVKEEEVAAE